MKSRAKRKTDFTNVRLVRKFLPKKIIGVSIQTCTKVSNLGSAHTVEKDLVAKQIVDNMKRVIAGLGNCDAATVQGIIVIMRCINNI